MGMTDRLEAMLEAGRDDAMLRFGLGSAYFNEGDMTGAIPHLEACIRQDPDYSAAYKLLGRAWFELDDLERAASVYREGLPVAEKKGDKQSQKEMQVFLKKIDKQADRDS